MKKGFTLMEILAVLLVLAVLASFAMPVIRSVRAEVRYQRAKSAALKMAEAMRSYYRHTKGYVITGDISADAAVTLSTCQDPALTGIPPEEIGGERSNPSIGTLFSCQYLSAKDFRDLPFTFSSCMSELIAGNNCVPSGTTGYVKVTGNANAGRYSGVYFTVLPCMKICEQEDVQNGGCSC